MTSVFSWQNSVSFHPASLCTPRPNLSVTPGISCLPTFAFHSPMINRTSFSGVSSRRPRQHIKKQRCYFAEKGPSSQRYAFPVVMYECQSWTIRKTDGFELWLWRRFLRVPWTARRSSQSILKEISPEYLLEGLMLKLMPQ